MMDPLRKLTWVGVAAGAAFMAAGSAEAQDMARNPAREPGSVAVMQLDAAHIHKSAAAADSPEFERMLQQKRQHDVDRKVGNAFNATSWYVPPPPPAPLPPPPPAAPPLPFKYLGQYKDARSAATVIFLASGTRVYTVSEGDVIDGTYSVGAIKSGQLELTYLPLNIKQSLTTGGLS